MFGDQHTLSSYKNLMGRGVIFNKVMTHGTVVAGRVDLREVVAVVDCPWAQVTANSPRWTLSRTQ